jgi:(2Fe-2S) ferredoxin
MSNRHKQTSTFALEGRFLGFEIEDGYKIKRIQLATAEGEVTIKLSKESRASVRGVLTSGDWLTVSGEKTLKTETGEIKYKAYLIQQASPGLQSSTPQIDTKPKSKPKATILMCQKSDCMKRGGAAVCQTLQQELSDRELTNQVSIKGTGCMKQCKAGPNMVMPDKTRYSKIAAADVPKIVDRHFGKPASDPKFDSAQLTRQQTPC